METYFWSGEAARLRAIRFQRIQIVILSLLVVGVVFLNVTIVVVFRRLHPRERPHLLIEIRLASTATRNSPLMFLRSDSC